MSKEVSDRICAAMNIQFSEGSFTYSFEEIKSINYYFEIHSEWTRGGVEMCMVSVIVNKEVPRELEEKISHSCSNLIKTMKLSNGIFAAFYDHELDSFDEEKRVIILSSKRVLKAWIKDMHEEIFGVQQLIE